MYVCFSPFKSNFTLLKSTRPVFFANYKLKYLFVFFNLCTKKYSPKAFNKKSYKNNIILIVILIITQWLTNLFIEKQPLNVLYSKINFYFIIFFSSKFTAEFYCDHYIRVICEFMTHLRQKKKHKTSIILGFIKIK